MIDMKYLSLVDTIGLTVVETYSSSTDKRKNPKSLEPEYILFSDGETYIVLEEQDYYDYHDCCSSARIIKVQRCKEVYDNIRNTYRPAASKESNY
jgi:hypothetical protein